MEALKRLLQFMQFIKEVTRNQFLGLRREATATQERTNLNWDDSPEDVGSKIERSANKVLESNSYEHIDVTAYDIQAFRSKVLLECKRKEIAYLSKCEDCYEDLISLEKFLSSGSGKKTENTSLTVQAAKRKFRKPYKKFAGPIMETLRSQNPLMLFIELGPIDVVERTGIEDVPLYEIFKRYVVPTVLKDRTRKKLEIHVKRLEHDLAGLKRTQKAFLNSQRKADRLSQVIRDNGAFMYILNPDFNHEDDQKA